MTALQPFPTITSSDPKDLMNAINQIARIRLQDIANQNNSNQNVQNIATTGTIACTATGTNTIALTQNANQNPIYGYQNYQQFSFVAANNSTGSITVNINTIGALNLYLPDGITQATTGNVIQNVLYTIAYNSALNSAAGGFVILNNPLDYASGKWTAAFVCGTSGTITINSSYNMGRYVKIGDMVFFSGIFIVSSVSAPVGSLGITGLPYIAGAANGNFSALSIAATTLTASNNIIGAVNASSNVISLQSYAGGSEGNLAGNVQASSQFIISGFYMVD